MPKKPFEDDDEEDLPIKDSKAGLKNVSSQKSIFDGKPKKPTQKDLDTRVKEIEDNNAGYKQRVADLAIRFRKLQEDKTLPVNRSIFANDVEREVLTDMIALATEINKDPNEDEGIGSLSWITLLFKTTLSLRDRLNKLEFALLQMEKNYQTNLPDLINKEIAKALDKKKISE